MLKDIITISRDEIANLKNEAIQSTLLTKVEEAKNKIFELKTVEECQEIEKELIDVINAYDKQLDNAVYPLAESCTFDKKEYKRSDVCGKILYFINKNQVDWQHTLGLYQTYKLWAATPSEIYYRHYDTTLRLLNLIKFQGMTEWTDILIINEFMSSCHHDYTVDTAWYLFLSEIHSSLISRADTLKKPSELNK